MRWARLERSGTDSWMTYRLPRPFDCGNDLDAWLARYLHGWQWVTGADHNPDENNLGEPDVLGPCSDDQ